MFRFGVIVLIACSSIVSAGESAKYCGAESKACTLYGANVFQARCTLCHGSDGLGEGVLALTIKDYPDTNLATIRYATDRDSLRKVIIYGGALPQVHESMPPWGDELTVTQVQSVVLFVELLRNDLEASITLLHREAKNVAPSRRVGRGIFRIRCTLCHGVDGEGDGKMARIIKDPPPFNLTKSRLPDGYLEEFISRGGQAMGRSSRMPPFGGDLTQNEIRSIILHLKSLRE